MKIADFGQSKLLLNHADLLMGTQPGTITYMLPEALKKGGEQALETNTGYTAKVDSFSLGALALEICKQSGPLSGFKNTSGLLDVIRCENDLSLFADAHPLQSLIVRCLQHETLRPTFNVIHNHVCETTKVSPLFDDFCNLPSICCSN